MFDAELLFLHAELSFASRRFEKWFFTVEQDFKPFNFELQPTENEIKTTRTELSIEYVNTF